MNKKFFLLITFLFISFLYQGINNKLCNETSINECESGLHDGGDDLCCLWKLPSDAKDLENKSYWLITQDIIEGYHQGCASMTKSQYQKRNAYGSKKARQNGIDKSITIECKSSNIQTLPKELEPCRKTTYNYTSAPTLNSCAEKTVSEGTGDSMCCYWKPKGNSTFNGFLDKDECAAINDDQFCNLDYYTKRKKKQYGLDDLEIICPNQGEKNVYCDRIYCSDSTEISDDGAKYCGSRKPKEGDSHCAMWNPDKQTSTNSSFAWLSGKTKCASINEEQFNDIANYEKRKRIESGMSKLKIVSEEKIKKCYEIEDAAKCKYSLENDGEDDICCKWSVPEDTVGNSNFWLLKSKYKQGSNYEGCASMTQQQNRDKSMFTMTKTQEYGLNNPIKMECEYGGNNIIEEFPAYKMNTKNDSQRLKLSFFIVLALFCLLA